MRAKEGLDGRSYTVDWKKCGRLYVDGIVEDNGRQYSKRKDDKV